MKKQYSKPDMFIVNFSSKLSIMSGSPVEVEKSPETELPDNPGDNIGGDGGFDAKQHNSGVNWGDDNE